MKSIKNNAVKTLCLSRRELLGGMAAVSAAAFFPWATRTWADSPGATSEQTIQDFLMLSERLTGREALDARIAGRVWQALLDSDERFADRQRVLAQAMDDANLTDMRSFKVFAATQPEALTQTAVAIISAWYLGFTGSVQGHSATDNTRFITYTGALMFEPTIDATVIPTYSRGHSDYWVDPPASIATD